MCSALILSVFPEMKSADGALRTADAFRELRLCYFALVEQLLYALPDVPGQVFALHACHLFYAKFSGYYT